MLEVHRETTSTNDLALEAADHGAEHGSCWVADRQTAGRGRRGADGQRREWYSPPNANLYMSLLLRPELDPDAATSMTLAAAAGIVDALEAESARIGADLDPWIKWPNDIMVDERKLAGVLTEASTGDGALDAVVVGLGLNVNVDADAVPSHLEEIMTSTRIETGTRWDRLALAMALREALIDRCEAFTDSGLNAVLGDVRSRDRTNGRSVEVQRDGDWETGISRGIDDRGRLVVELDDRTLPVQSGEVRFPDL